MKSLLLRVQKSLGVANSGHVSAIWQGILHVAAVYFVARLCMPWLVEVIYGRFLPLLLGHRLAANPFQFLFSHLLVLSFLPGFAAGFVNAKLFRDKVVRFTWLVPAVVLLFWVLTGPGMYPTMLWESDFRQAFHFFFGGGFNIVGEYQNYRDLPSLMTKNTGDFLRGYAQFRATVPAYAGIAYSVGAWLSLRIKRSPTQAQKMQGRVAETPSAS
jgi:hypothetical protein